MSLFQLDPESIAERARVGNPSIPTLKASIVLGMIGFTIVSVAGFVPWALFGGWFYRHLGEAGMYGVCAIVFMGLSAPMLHWLIIGPGSMSRFYKLFGISFAAYSVAWIIGWMLIGDDPESVVGLGSVVGLLIGTTVMGWILVIAFEARGQLLKVVVALFALNTVGYFIGGEITGALIREHEMVAKLLWGVAYGMGFGAGLGLAFYLCQTRARALLAAPVASPS